MSQQQLEYEPSAKGINWKPWVRPAAIAVAVLILVLLLEQPARNLYQQWRRRQAVGALLRLQAACMRYSMPQGMLVLDHSPGTAALLRQPGYKPIIDSGGRSYSHAAVFVPPLLKEFQDSTTGLYARPLSARAEGVVFMHERKTPSGTPVLIVAHPFTDGQPDPKYEPWYEIRMFRMIPATPTVGPRNADDWYNLLISIQRPVDGVLQIRAGQPDQADASHFVIPILKGDKSIDLHCWLRDDFKIKVRADGGIVRQNAPCTDADVYWSWPASLEPGSNPDFHRGLD